MQSTYYVTEYQALLTTDLVVTCLRRGERSSSHLGMICGQPLVTHYNDKKCSCNRNYLVEMTLSGVALVILRMLKEFTLIDYF